ncbi:MAG: OmpA family protein [Alphaproteobacteria bacterium]|nr:OmpA family protein [Alphaproteobacteria bacterium]
MDGPNGLAPIIIKRKKVIAASAAHGGAWKVAYADFVTAMMAFFMLMWLLNATTEKQRKGIADYFSPTIAVNRISGGGDGMFGGKSVFTEDVLPQNGTGASSRSPSSRQQARGDVGRGDSGVKSGQAQAKADKAQLEALDKRLAGNSGESSVADKTLQHIFTRVTDEGLIVEIFDLPDQPLFEKDGTPSIILGQLITMIARVIKPTTNQLAINAYLRSVPVVLRVDQSWKISTDRAQTVRKMLEQGGLPKQRMERVVGWANRKPADPNPMSVRNNRLEIILLRNDKAARGNN